VIDPRFADPRTQAMTEPAAAAFPVYLDQDTLLRRTAELARAIAEDAGDQPPLLVSVIEGARVFARHLQQRLPFQVPVHEIRASSYGTGTESSGDVVVTGGEQLPVAGRDVLLVEDIVDTGRTVARLDAWFRERGAADFRVATLLTKPARRVVPVDLHYVGFEIEDLFVIGFGMDYAGKYRDLPHVAIYQQ